MSERAALIDAVLENPDDDAPRLAFADWLDVHTQSLPEEQRAPLAARSEFIRIQCELARLPKGQRHRKLPKREKELLDQFGVPWGEMIGYRTNQYSRGFATIPLDYEQFAEIIPAALKIEPVFAYTMESDGLLSDDPTAWYDAYADGPNLRTLIGLSLARMGCGPDGFSRLIRPPQLKNLGWIRVFVDEIGVQGVRALTEAPFRLWSLHLDRAIPESETLETVEIIANSPQFSKLTKLLLPNNGLGNECVEMLLASKTLSPQVELHIYGNPYDTAAFKERLTERFGQA